MQFYASIDAGIAPFPENVYLFVRVIICLKFGMFKLCPRYLVFANTCPTCCRPYKSLPFSRVTINAIDN